MFTRAIARRPSPEMIHGISTARLGLPDPGLALKQHDAYVRALEGGGLTVDVLDPEPGFPDGCFVEDVAVVCEGVAIVGSLGALVRRGEQETVAPALARFRPIVHVEPPATFEGGDVLRMGNLFFIGLSTRTNSAGARSLAAILRSHGHEVRIVDCDIGLHLKTDVNPVGEDVLLVSPYFDLLPEFADFRRIVVEDDEAHARNSLWVNGTIFTPTGFPRTREKLERLGMPVMTLDVSEFRKLDGGLTCLSLRF